MSGNDGSRLRALAPVTLTIGRDELLRELRATLGGGDGAVWLTGPPGVGKTHLGRAVVGALAASGTQVEEIFGGSAATGVPLGACVHMVPVLPGEVPLAALLAATLDRLRRRAARGPLVIFADDADFLDEASATLVSHLVGVPGIGVVATARDPARAPRPLTGLLHQGRFQAFVVEPLAPAAVAQLAAHLAGSALDRASDEHLYQVTGGNPLWVTELVRAAMRRRALHHTACGLHLDTDTAVGGLDLVLAERLGNLGPAERDAVELLAVGGALPVAVLESLVGVEAPAALTAAGLITVMGRPDLPALRLVHRLHRRAVRASLDALQVRALLRRLIAAVGPGRTDAALDGQDRAMLVRLALWHAELGEPFDPAATGWAVRAVHWGLLDLVRRHLAGEPVAEAAGEAGLALGLRSTEDRAAASYRLASGAWREDPTFVNGVALARAMLFRPEQSAEMVELLTRLRELAATDEEWARLAVLQASWLFWIIGDRDAALDELRRADTALEAPWDTVVAAARAGLTLNAGRIADGLAVLEARRPGRDAPAAVRVAHAAALAAALNLSGRADEGLALTEAALPTALPLGEGSFPSIAELLMHQHAAKVWLGRYEETAASARAFAGMLAETEDNEWRALFVGIDARCLLAQGKPATAAAELSGAIRSHGPVAMFAFRPTLHATRAFALAWTGRLAEARAELAEARRWDDPPRFFDPELDLVDATLLAAEGRRARAVEVAAATREAAAAAGSRYHAFFAAYLVARLQPDTAARRALDEAAAGIAGHLPDLARHHAAALQANEVSGLEAVAEEARTLGEHLLAVEVLEGAVAVARRQGSSAARLRAEAALAQQREACEQASSPLTTLAAAPPGLTGRELEIAGLAAKGWTSAAIAAELVLSVRTVESHLYRAFAKLGIRSRDDLAPALRGRA